MQLENNRIPDRIKTIHLIAVCGTGMGALACMLKDIGFQVTGSDEKVYPPMSDFLRAKGIPFTEGVDGANLAYAPDLVIIGNAVRRENPEVAQAMRMGLNFCSMPQALNGLVARGKKPILVTGTHGKTTTSSLMAWVLHAAGLDPSFMIGGIVRNFGSNYRLGRGEHIVIEGDEYDTAFFDKGPKFMHYIPHLAILTSIEFDHADIFKDLEHVRRTFHAFIRQIPAESRLLVHDGDANIDALLHSAQNSGSSFASANDISCRVAGYGRRNDSPWRLGEIEVDPPWSRFEIFRKGRRFGNFQTRMVGEHNLLNALAVVAAADHLGIATDVIVSALESFEGVRRRQEIRGIKKGVTVMDDFAHHPTAVRETLKAVKPFYPQGRIIAVFEPRTNSSMRKVFQEIYPLSFDAADLICIREPSMLSKIPVEERFSSRKLVDDLNKKGKPASYFSDTESIVDFLSQEAVDGDLIIIMSNGGFDNIHEKVLKNL